MKYFSQDLKDLVVNKSEIIAFHLVQQVGRSESAIDDSKESTFHKIDLQIEYLQKFCDLMETKLEKSLEFSIEIMELSLEKKRRVWQVLKQIEEKI